MGILFIILGIITEVVKANAWFIIPNFVSYILFGLGGVCILIQVITYFSTKKKFNSMSKDMRNRFNRF